MKRFGCLFLAVAMTWMCGCHSESVSSFQSIPQDEAHGESHALVNAACDALLQENMPARVRLVCGVNEQLYVGLRVETTPALLAGIADALYYGVQGEDVLQKNPAVAEGDSVEDSTMIEVVMPDVLLTVVLRQQADGCSVYLSQGDESALWLYPKAVYQTVLSQAEENLVPDTLAVNGEISPIQTQRVASENQTAQWMECVGGLAALYTWAPEGNRDQQTSALEIFDIDTGESLYYQEIGCKALRMEGVSFNACDMRVLMEDGTVWYLNSQNPEVKPYYFYLPVELKERLLAPWPQNRPVFRSYDAGASQGAVWAVVDEEGLS